MFPRAQTALLRVPLCVFLAACGFALTHAAVGAEEATIDVLEQRFRTLPMDSRRLTGPLFWLHGDESAELLEAYVEKVAEGGNGCLTTESRPHIDWLGEGWYRDLQICLDAAKKHDLKMWIFDEKWWPSGEVGKNVPARYGSKRLSVAAKDVTGPATLTLDGFSADGKEHFVAAIAGKVQADTIDGMSLVDLAPHVANGKLTWDVPAGDWRVMKFAAEPEPVHGRYLVDGASGEAIDWYLETVYQPHYDRFKDDFGTHIVGFFYDEPETHGDWGTEVIPVLKERGIDWKKALVAFKYKLAGEEQIAARYQYLDAFAEAWGRTMYGRITKWCEDRGVQSIGHWLEHANAYVNPNLCAGDMFAVQKYSSMGGIDAVFSQFRWGQREAFTAPCWQTPKLGSSITHAYGKPDDITMVEIFGARGQDLSYPEMKWWTDHMHVSGVNFLIPHAFNPRSPYDTDCPPYFYNNGHEPRWPLYRVFADYTSRLSAMLTGGRHVCPVALLWAGQAVHVGTSILPDKMSEALQDALYDCDWLPCEVFENDVTLDDKRLKLRDESYRVLIVPAAEVIRYDTLGKARAFFDGGGVVIGYGMLPRLSATPGKTSVDIARLRETVWGTAAQGLQVCRTSAAGGRSYFLPELPTPEQLQQVLAGDAGVHATLEVLEGDTDHWLHVLHRVKAGCDLFFITNQNHTGDARTFRFRIKAKGYPECWDAMRNEITTVPFTRDGENVELSLTFEPNESVLLVFRQERRSLPARLFRRTSKPLFTAIVERLANPPVEVPPIRAQGELYRRFEDCAWMWYPVDNAAISAPQGDCFFRKQIALPGDRKIENATFHGTADNSFVLYVNGREIGGGDPDPGSGWRRPVALDVTSALAPGANQLAIVANNALNHPSPAGMIGKLVVTFERGEPVSVPVDATWKASTSRHEDWATPGADDSAWPQAKEVARFGGGPWGLLGPPVTLSPFKADPFFGEAFVKQSPDPDGRRVYLEMDALAPEEAARITINGEDCGGFLGRPLRLDVTKHVRSGRNTVRIEPFAPTGEVRLVGYAW